MSAIREAAARAIFVDAWASYAEEQGFRFSPGTELMDAAPETPTDALEFADQWAEKFQALNGISIEAAFEALCAEGSAEDGMAEDFGHYSMMQALGHGVAWSDDHKPHAYKIPAAEAWGHLSIAFSL